jgi:hypothetical protein
MRDAGVNSQAWNSGSLGPSAESSNDDRLRDALLPLGTADRRVREGEGWSEMLVGCARVSKADGSQVLDL